ncbi:MAG: type I restriction-modification system endonuclease [Burkholderiales bacterium]|nr:type I restriction-modification system endonuclease [Burkholderiales bacterium]
MSQSNFSFLGEYSPLLAELGATAERIFPFDPPSAVVKLRLLSEAIAQEIASRVGVTIQPRQTQLELLNAIQRQFNLDPQIQQFFHRLRQTGNTAAHEVSHKIGYREGMDAIKLAREIAVWFHRTFGKQPDFKPGAFVLPDDPSRKLLELQQQISQLNTQLNEAQSATSQQAEMAQLLAAEAEQERVLKARAVEENAIYQQLAEEASQRYTELKAEFDQKLANTPAPTDGKIITEYARRGAEAARKVQLDEAATRVLIDEQLREMGWEADTVKLDYRKGIRPEAGRCMAIAERPVYNAKGQPKRADYVLFHGLKPLAILEAKRYGNDVADDLRQAEEYAAGLTLKGVPADKVAEDRPAYVTHWAGLNKEQYQVPFVFASNARPWLPQLQTKSGIWFRDLRDVTNHPRPLMNWHAPDELLALLDQNKTEADQALLGEALDYLKLRDYQQKAIHCAEQAIADGKRSALLAMATGTGKTKTVIGLIYRLLKAKRFERILFLVDRNSLGTQAQDAFKEYRLEGDMLFSSIYDVKELEDKVPDSETRVHVATVQAMVKRIFESDDPMPIRRYDCIVVDEAHRGYVLDRGMSEGEMVLRDELDYISSYRRVLEYFDAVRIGLTATPALHTIEIFGRPVFTYTYAEAVVDGYLVDHEPPISFETELMQNHIRFEKGEAVDTVTLDGEVDSETLADDLVFEVDAFNRAVINENFSRVIVEKMAKDYLDPTSPEKTLVFCVNDTHADLVVSLFKGALDTFHGPQPDGLVQKITGAVRDPVGAIRQFRTQAYPKIVTTVDLLTTGVDVPAITNLLFMRRVRSRILYEQMKGRATRLCDDFQKDTFRIYDAVRLYQALAAVDTMLPTTRQPAQTLESLIEELQDTRSDELAGHVKNKEAATHADQVLVAILSRLQRLQRRVKQAEQRDEVQKALTTLNQTLLSIGAPSLNGLVPHLKEHGPKVARELFNATPKLLEQIAELADTVGLKEKLYISTHPDRLVDVVIGYGKREDGTPIVKPQDYLEYFTDFIRNNLNKVTALQVIATKPKNLTREDLRQLVLWLDKQGFAEARLEKAWHDASNVDIAATIIGYIRQAAVGDALVPFGERVERAVGKILQSRAWTPNQQKALRFIAERVKHGIVIDDELWQSAPLRDRYGAKPFDQLNRLFDGEFGQIVDQFADSLWAMQA